jgi:hypothetical protein
MSCKHVLWPHDLKHMTERQIQQRGLLLIYNLKAKRKENVISLIYSSVLNENMLIGYSSAANRNIFICQSVAVLPVCPPPPPQRVVSGLGGGGAARQAQEAELY